MQDVNGYLFRHYLSFLVLVSHPTLDTAVKGFFYRLAVICVCVNVCHPQRMTERSRPDQPESSWTGYIKRQSSSLLCVWFWLKVVHLWSSESSRCLDEEGGQLGEVRG